MRVVLACLLLAAACSSPPANQPPPATSNAVLFEGAQLIVGDGSAPIPDSAFLVENGTFTRIGKKGELVPPDGAQARRPDRQDGHARTHRCAQPPWLHGREGHDDGRRQLHARESRRPSASLCVLRDCGDAQHGGRSRGIAVPGTSGTHQGCRVVSNRGQRDRPAQRRSGRRVPEGSRVRSDDRSGGQKSGSGARRQESGHRQDLGGRSIRHREEAAAAHVSGDHRGGPHTQSPCGRPYLRSGRCQRASASRHRRFRPWRARQGCRRRIPRADQAAAEGLRHTEPAGQRNR